MFCLVKQCLVKLHPLTSFHINHRQYCIVQFVHNFSQIFDPNFRYFFRLLEVLGIHWFKQQILQLFVRSFHESRMSMLVFCCCSSNINIMFFKQLRHLALELRTVINLDGLGIFERVTFLTDCLQYKCNLARFFSRKGPGDFKS